MNCAALIVLLLSIISCQSKSSESSEKAGNSNNSGGLEFLNSFPYTYASSAEQQEKAKESRNQHQQDQESSSYQLPDSATSGSTSQSRVVDTKYGKLQGLVVTLFPGSTQNQNSKYPHPLRNKLVEVFLNIPYALPPVKSRRFSPTQTPVPWEGIRQATKPGFVCPQVMPEIRDEATALKEMPRGHLNHLRRLEPHLRNQSEDCLYLNVFAPTTTTTGYNSQSSKSRLKPVLVFIHGGRYAWGSGNLYDGTLLAAYADLIFVTLNYRLGVLGFLNVNSSPTTRPRVANYGLMDQIAALHWIKENIAQFGGDPENITMMGYEAGAACINFLMSSPAVVPGLFHRAILIAGSARAPWALVHDPAEVATALAESLNCSVNSTTNVLNSTFTPLTQVLGARERDSASFSRSTADPVLDCLKNKHFSSFSKYTPPKFTVDFGPSVDGIVIQPNFGTGYEPQLGKRSVSSKYDLMFGLSSMEMLTSFSEADLVSGFEGSRRDAVLRTLVRNSFRFHLNEIFATISNEYVDWDRGIQHPISSRDMALNAVTDCMSLAPVIAASESSQVRKSYFYLFEHATKDGLYSFQKNGGAAGGEELNYFFGFPMVDTVLSHFPSPLPSNFTKSEVALSELMTNYLSNFVHDGDPNGPNQGEGVWQISREKNKFKNVAWEPYDRLHQKYLELSATKVRIRSHYRAHQMAIWLRLVPELQRSGAQYVSTMHNRMNGGYDPSLYIGNFRLPEELEAANEIHHYTDNLDFGDYFFNGTLMLPAPPTTCLSPLASLVSEYGTGNTEIGASILRATEERGSNKTHSRFQAFVTAYTNNLPLTVAISCSLLILNIFIFAILYYHHEKKQSSPESRLLVGNGNAESQLNNYSYAASEPPELLKSSSTTATSFHQSQSVCSYEMENHRDCACHCNELEQRNQYGGSGCVDVNIPAFLDHEHMKSTLTRSQQCHNSYDGMNCHQEDVEPVFTHNAQIHPVAVRDTFRLQPVYNSHDEKMLHQSPYDSSWSSVPEPIHHQFDPMCAHFGDVRETNNGNQGTALGNPHALEAENNTATDNGQRKPFLPGRNISTYTITQRQLFSVIMTHLLTFGIL